MSFLLSLCVFMVLVSLTMNNLGLVWSHGYTKLFALALLAPAFVSFLFIPLNALVSSTFVSDPSIALSEASTRIINLLLNFTIFAMLVGYGVDKYGKKYARAVLIIYYVILLAMMLGGVWQIASKVFGVPFPDMGLRTNFHGVGSTVRKDFGFRITSFFAEPSYFAPYIIDAILVGLIVIKNSLIKTAVTLLGILVLVSTFSMSGMFNLVFLGLALAVAFALKKQIRHSSDISQTLFLLAAIFGLAGLAWFAVEYLIPYYDRFNAFIVTGDDKRFYIINRAFEMLGEGFPHTMIFGYGPGSFAFFKYLADPMEGTSNNLYIDVMLEQGLFGLTMIVLMFAYLITRGYKRIDSKFNNIYGFAFAVHLSITSMYRADFASPRFWVVLLIIYILITPGEVLMRNANKVKHVKHVGSV